MTARPLAIDTHAHLDDEQFGGETEAVVERARAAGIGRIINIGYRPARWTTTLALAERFPMVAFTLGLHPHHAEEWSDQTESELLGLIARNLPVAIGEIGLDYNRNFNPPDVQRRVFERQLAIAADARLPVVIHQRDAEADLLAILRDLPSGLACVLHSFDGTSQLAGFAVERGHMLGVGGLMTRAKSDALRGVLAGVPVSQLLLETDSPYLVPAGVKSRRNEPANLARVIEMLAVLLKTAQSDIVEETTRNAERIFGPRLGTGPCPAEPTT